MQVRVGGERWLLHRLVYRTAVGPLYEGLEINHLCNTRNCVNPVHLEQVTHKGNMEWAAAGRTHCARGHEWTPENTYIRKDRASKSRECRACKREDQKARYHRARSQG